MLAAAAPFVLPVPGASFVRPFKAGYGVRLTGSSSGYVGLKPAAVAGATDFTLPTGDAIGGGCWVSDGSGNLSVETTAQTYTRLGITATTPAGVGTELQYRNGSSFGAITGSSWNGTTLSTPALAVANNITLTRDGSGGYVETYSYRNSAFGGGFVIGHARGTLASPLVLNSGDAAGSIFFSAWDGAQFYNVASIIGAATGTQGIGATPGILKFSTTPAGSPFEQVRLTIDQNGHLSVESTSIYKWSTDTGLARSAAGVVEINNGSAGTLARLFLSSAKVENNVSGNIGVAVVAAVSQTANLQEWQNSAGTMLHSINADGLVRNNAFGIHDFAAFGTGEQILKIGNKTSGTGNYGGFRIVNDNTNTITCLAMSSTFTTSGGYVQGSGVIDCQGVGGLTIAADHASGVIRFYAGGIGTSDEKMRLTTTGFGIGTTSPSTKLHVVGTTEQLRIGYDASYYASFTVSSAGLLTIASTANQILLPTTTFIGSTDTGVGGSGIVHKLVPSPGANFYGSLGLDHWFGIGNQSNSIAFGNDYSGKSRLILRNTGAIFNYDGDDVDFTVNGDTVSPLLFVDAGNNRIGLGTGTPESLLSLDGTSYYYIGFSNSGTSKARLGIEFVADQMVVGSSVNDTYWRGANTNFIFSCVNGNSVDMKLTPTGAGFGSGVVPSTAIAICGSIPIIDFQNAGVGKISTGLALGTDYGVIGSVANDFYIRCHASNNMLFSTNNGSSPAFYLSATAGLSRLHYNATNYLTTSIDSGANTTITSSAGVTGLTTFGNRTRIIAAATFQFGIGYTGSAVTSFYSTAGGELYITPYNGICNISSGGSTGLLRVSSSSSSEISLVGGGGNFITSDSMLYFYMSPSGGATRMTLDVNGELTNIGTLAYPVHTYKTAATNDDPKVSIYQNRVATTDATVTTLHTIAIADNTTYALTATVECRCTGGAGGNSGKAARFDFITRVRRSGGIALLGTVTSIYSDQDGTAWAATFDVDGGNNARIRVTGAATDDITWHVVELKVSPLSS